MLAYAPSSYPLQTDSLRLSLYFHELMNLPLSLLYLLKVCLSACRVFDFGWILQVGLLLVAVFP